MRYGLFKAGTSRVVLDLMEPSEVARAEFVPAANGEPLRLLVDLRPVPETQFRAQLKSNTVAYSAIAAIAPVTKPTARTLTSSGAGSSGGTGAATGALGGSAAKQPIEEPKRGKPLIVIDPGHGGPDTGTVAASGEMEKAIVLEFAQTLSEKLEKSGKYRVLMTRTDDRFVPLGDRVRFARHEGAALFVSIHADALAARGEADVRGATVYTLSDTASDSEAARLAEDENKADAIAGVDLSSEPEEVAGILVDLAQRETKNFSHHFARTVVGELKTAAKLHRNPLKSAGFKVLKAPDVPSVLIELGYVSNKQDLKLMTSDAWRTRTSEAVAQAVNTFFSTRLAGSGPARGAN
jgi:N-acetylmuramoyl-L-alanine amidase